MAIRVPNRPPDFSRWTSNPDEKRKDESQRNPPQRQRETRTGESQFERDDDRKGQRPESD